MVRAQGSHSIPTGHALPQLQAAHAHVEWSIGFFGLSSLLSLTSFLGKVREETFLENSAMPSKVKVAGCGFRCGFWEWKLSLTHLCVFPVEATGCLQEESSVCC